MEERNSLTTAEERRAIYLLMQQESISDLNQVKSPFTEGEKRAASNGLGPSYHDRWREERRTAGYVKWSRPHRFSTLQGFRAWYVGSAAARIAVDKVNPERFDLSQTSEDNYANVEIDLLALSFTDLPPAWQDANIGPARTNVEYLSRQQHAALSEGREYAPRDLSEFASFIHDDWVISNWERLLDTPTIGEQITTHTNLKTSHEKAKALAAAYWRDQAPSARVTLLEHLYVYIEQLRITAIPMSSWEVVKSAVDVLCTYDKLSPEEQSKDIAVAAETIRSLVFERRYSEYLKSREKQLTHAVQSLPTPQAGISWEATSGSHQLWYEFLNTNSIILLDIIQRDEVRASEFDELQRMLAAMRGQEWRDARATIEILARMSVRLLSPRS